MPGAANRCPADEAEIGGDSLGEVAQGVDGGASPGLPCPDGAAAAGMRCGALPPCPARGNEVDVVGGHGIGVHFTLVTETCQGPTAVRDLTDRIVCGNMASVQEYCDDLRGQ